MERIVNPKKYEAKEPFRKKLGRLFLKYLIWLPLAFLMVGLVVVLLFYRYQQQQEVQLGVHYDKTVSRNDYKKETEPSRLKQFEDKLNEQEQHKRRGRYDHIVSGKDVVSVNFGQPIYSFGDEPAQPMPSLPDSSIKTEVKAEELRATAPRKRMYRRSTAKVARKEITTADTLETKADSVKIRNPFASLRLKTQKAKPYTLAYIYGEQEVFPGSFIKLRLGEEMIHEDEKIPEGTVFTGKVQLSSNSIQIKVSRMLRHNVDLEVYDTDYSHGIVLNSSRHQDMEEAANNSVYRSAGRSVIDLPYEVLQDVTQSIIRSKRKKQNIIKLNDGYQVYLAQPNV